MDLQTLLRNRWFRIAGYALLGGLSFAYFLFEGFPFDRVLTGQLANVEKNAGLKVEFGGLRTGWLFDLVATDVKVTPVARGRGFGPAPTAPEDPVAKIDKVVLHPHPFALLLGRLGVGVDASLYGGNVSGSLAAGRSVTVVDLSVKNVELAKYPMLASRFQLNAVGQISGTIQLNLPADDASKATGKIDLAVKNCRLDESNPYNLVRIPGTSFDKGAGAQITLKDGKASFDEVGLKSEELEVTVDGDIDLRKQLAMSQWNARANIRASDGFKTAVPLLDTFLNPGKGSDGVYHYKLSGIFGSPRPAPDRGH